MTRAATRDDPSYYGLRAAEEDGAAKSAVCAAARERHQEMADIYRFRIAMLSPRLDPPSPSNEAAAVDLLAD